MFKFFKKNLLFLFGALVLLSVSASAQETPQAELAVGYSYAGEFHDVGNESSSGLTAPHRVDLNSLHGFNVSVAGNLNNWFGLVADMSGHYNSNRNVHTFLFGPRFSYRNSTRVTPFAQALFGGAHAGGDRVRNAFLGFDVVGAPPPQIVPVYKDLTDTSFAMTVGGGFDVKVCDALAVRPIQAEYLLTRFDGDSQHNVRLTTGLVFRFGKK